MQRLILLLSIFFSLPALAVSITETPNWQRDGFAQPESIIVHTQSGDYFVTNINGAPNEMNSKGYISRVSADGKILNEHWFDGLHAPKGMAIFENILVVSDLNRVWMIKIKDEAGELHKMFTVESAKFLNDVTVDSNGTFYISDMLGHAIYELENETLSLWLKDNGLSHPNGLDIDSGYLYVASWGQDMSDDFSTKSPGEVLQVSRNTKEIEVLAVDVGNLDALIKVDDGFITNDWMNGKVFHVSDGNAEEIAKYAPGLADISLHEQLLLMPFMHDGKVEARQIHFD